MNALLMSHCPNPSTNLIECPKNNSGIKTLTVVPHDLRVVSNAITLWLHNPFSNPNARPKQAH